VFGLFGLRLRDVNWICLYNGPMLRDIQLTQSGLPMLAEILVRLRDRRARRASLPRHSGDVRHFAGVDTALRQVAI
jgi:hypothetical protein